MPYLQHFLEYSEWGINLTTGTFILTVLTTLCLNAPGLTAQILSIWRSHSVTGISVFTHVSLFGFGVIFFAYSLIAGNAGGFLNGLVIGALESVLIYGVYRFGSLGTVNWGFLIGVGISFLVLLLKPNWAGPAYGIISLIVWLGVIKQGLTTWHTKDAGHANAKMFLLFAFGSFIWLSYGLVIQDWYIMLTMTAFMLAQLFTAVIIMATKVPKRD